MISLGVANAKSLLLFLSVYLPDDEEQKDDKKLTPKRDESDSKSSKLRNFTKNKANFNRSWKCESNDLKPSRSALRSHTQTQLR